MFYLIESSLDQELSVVRCGLSDADLPNYISLMVRLLTLGCPALLSSVYCLPREMLVLWNA